MPAREETRYKTSTPLAIAGDSPTSGVRVDLVRSAAAPGALRYDGFVEWPGERRTVQVTVAGDVVSVEIDAAADMAERIRLMVRTALRHTTADGLPPPRRIQRWRDD